MFSLVIYFRNIAESIQLTFDRHSDREAMLILISKSMNKKEILTLTGPSGVIAVIDSTEVRAVVNSN